MTLYIPDVDSQGHEKGEHGVDSSLHIVDRGLERLMTGISERGLDSFTDIVVVSDHGMVR